MKIETRTLSLGISTTAFSFAIAASVICLAPTTHAIHGAVNTNESSIEVKINNETERESGNEISTEAREKSKEQITEKERQRTESTEAKARRDAVKEKLSATKLEICNTRKDAIDRHVIRIAVRTEKHLGLFDEIAKRAQEFYMTKGNVLDNYGTLSAEVASKKDVATAAVDTLVAQKAVFDCEADDPKGTIATYKAILGDTTGALKEYRTSIKNLIFGIKSVNTNGSTE